jgi:hypothetical protein
MVNKFMKGTLSEEEENFASGFTMMMCLLHSSLKMALNCVQQSQWQLLYTPLNLCVHRIDLSKGTIRLLATTGEEKEQEGAKRFVKEGYLDEH